MPVQDDDLKKELLKMSDRENGKFVTILLDSLLNSKYSDLRLADLPIGIIILVDDNSNNYWILNETKEIISRNRAIPYCDCKNSYSPIAFVLKMIEVVKFWPDKKAVAYDYDKENDNDGENFIIRYDLKVDESTSLRDAISYGEKLERRLESWADIMLLTGTTGYPWADAKIPEIISKIENNIAADQLNYLKILVSILNYMGQNNQEQVFKNANFNEKDFQTDITEHFRRSGFGQSAIGEVNTGAGRVDLLVDGVPVELKVEKKETDTKKMLEAHKNQASSYATSQGKRVGILGVLDLTEKNKPCACPDNDIQVITIDVHGYAQTNLQYPSQVISFIVRGNVPNPSDLK